MIFLLAIQALGFLGSVHAQSGVTLTPTPNYVDPATGSVSLRCAVDGAVKLYNTNGLLIEKEIDTDVWQSYARYIKGSASASAYQVGVTATAQIGAAGGKSYLQLTIPSSAGPVGRFRCTATGTTSAGAAATQVVNSEVFANQYQDGCTCCDKMAALEAKILSFEIIASKVTTLESRLSAVESSVSSGGGSGLPGDALKGMDGDLVLRSLVWPEGYYGLLMPETGCPSQGFSFVDWRSDGYRQFHTESTSTVNLDKFSPDIHLKQPYQNTNGAQRFIFLYFCMNIEGPVLAEGPTWPSGSYCINKWAGCPEGFHEGSIFWDEENTWHDNKYSDLVPNGAYGGDTRIDYCCRRDGKPEVPVYLPTAKPFYLYRFDGKCQQVAGMNVTNEFIVFDTENTGGNIDKYTGEYHPDGRLNDVRVELCYYSR